MAKLSEPLFTFKRGDHVCMFYQDEASMIEVLVPYILEGLVNGEQCFCVLPPRYSDGFLEALTRTGVDPDREMTQRALVVQPPEDVYFPTGNFEGVAMIAMLGGAIAEAGRLGFTGFRSAGELSWAAHGRCDCNRIVEYESMVDAVFPQQGATGMCLYDMKEFPKPVLDKVIGAHRLSVDDSVADTQRRSLAVRHGEFYADITVDRADPSRFYYVAQESESADVLGWGYSSDFQLAIAHSERLMTEVVGARAS